jgi:hypothetical protein
MTDGFAAAVGTSARFSWPLAESDIYIFAGLTWDLCPNHVD